MLDAAHGEAVGTTRIVQRVDVRRREVQVARVGIAGTVGRRSPVITVRADVRQGSRLAVAVARSNMSAIAGMDSGKKTFLN